MKILKPTASLFPITFKVPADLAKRLADAQAAARNRGLTLDLDQPLMLTLKRLLKQAEAELDTDPSPGQETPPATPPGATAAPLSFEGGEHA